MPNFDQYRYNNNMQVTDNVQTPLVELLGDIGFDMRKGFDEERKLFSVNRIVKSLTDIASSNVQREVNRVLQDNHQIEVTRIKINGQVSFLFCPKSLHKSFKKFYFTGKS